MTELDATGLRANDPGLTREALRAERKAASRAWWARFWRGLGHGVLTVLRWIPRVVLAAIVVSIAAAATAFDWFMSGQGWLDILPGLGMFAYAGAAASVGFWYVGVFRARQEHRSGDKAEAQIWMAVAGAAYLICIIGVGIATITNTGEAKQQARDDRAAYARLVAERDQKQDWLDLNDPEFLKAALAADESTLAALEASARGTHGMPDLDMGSGCPAPPKKFTMERLCAQANGGIDPFNGEVHRGFRVEIEAGKVALRKAEETQADLVALNEQLRTFKVSKGDKTARALAEFMENDEAAGDKALLFVLVFLSAAFLFCGGFFGDAVVRMLLTVK